MLRSRPTSTHTSHDAGTIHGVEPICCQPIPAHISQLSQPELMERMALFEAQTIQAVDDVRRLYQTERARLVELDSARAQMLAYADDLRAAFKAERARRAELEHAYVEVVRALASAIDARDPYTGGHVDRVASYATALGRELGWHEEDLKVLEVGALLHDIGKIAVADAILRKNGPLDDAEWVQMKRHPTIGAGMLAGLVSLRNAAPAVLYHHERYDGKGYPKQLAGEAIPRIARIVTIADAFDAMLTDRPYRQGLPIEVAISEFNRCISSQFDPEYTEAFVGMLNANRLTILRRDSTAA